ncbi:MAG: hypothetical protein JW749_11135, partial [Sedimentisphaerales bacterium]|nr:hypothetical protein [Sedimentisphaerales bacterium]
YSSGVYDYRLYQNLLEPFVKLSIMLEALSNLNLPALEICYRGSGVEWARLKSRVRREHQAEQISAFFACSVVNNPC